LAYRTVTRILALTMPKSRWQVSKIDMSALDVRKLSSTLLINRFKANSHLAKLKPEFGFNIQKKEVLV